MTSNSAVDGSIPSVQSFEPEQPTAEPLDPSLLDAVPDVSTVQPDTLQSESMTRSASNKAEDGATIAKDNNDIRQEAMALTMEEARLPLRKDVSMREFLSKMDDYAPVIPDAVTFHALTLAGLKPPSLSSLQPQPQPHPQNPTAQAGSAQPDTSVESDHIPLRLARLISLATQKFIADVATDAYQYSRMRTGVLTSNSLSAIANPGAAAGAAGGGGTAGSGSTMTVAGAPGGGGTSTKSGANAHVLGVQRAGFGGGGHGGGHNRAVLTLEDLGMSVGEYGVNIKRGEFYR